MLSQQARTRAVLDALGIPLWGLRSASYQTAVVLPIWGKQEDHLEDVQSLTTDVKPTVAVIVGVESDFSQTKEQFVERSSAHTIESSPSIKQKTDVQPDERTTRLLFTQVITTSESIHVEHVIRFSLEARVIGQWVVLVSVQALNHPDRNTLWRNISESLLFRQDSQEVCRFDWPLAEGARWQKNTGAQAALMGFLTRFGSERRIGLMGELPDAIIPDHLERFPSLDELLQEPLKKRSLWRLLSGALR